MGCPRTLSESNPSPEYPIRVDFTSLKLTMSTHGASTWKAMVRKRLREGKRAKGRGSEENEEAERRKGVENCEIKIEVHRFLSR